jgi:hypothetical protein
MDGDIITNEGFGNIDSGDWISPKTSAPGSYQVNVTLISGTLSNGATGLQNLTTSRSWSVSRFAPGIKSCQFTLQILLSGTVLDSTTVTLSAEIFEEEGGGGGFEP